MAENMAKFLGYLANGIPVYDRFKSHWHSEGGLTPELLQAALRKIDTTDKFHVETVVFDHVVGLTMCVSVSAEDRVVYAVRKGRTGPTPMVLNREPEPTNAVTIILKRIDGQEAYFLVTAFTGPAAEKEPWDRTLVPGSTEHRRAVEFWRTHALIYNEEVIDHLVW